jgi:hypothetical protein
MPLRLRGLVKASRVAALVADLPTHFELKGADFSHRTHSGDALRASLADSYECPADLHDLEFWECVRTATRQLFPRGPFSVEAFESSLEAVIGEFRRTPPAPYITWSRFNYRPSATAHLRFVGSSISVYRHLPRKLGRHWIDPRESNSAIPESPEGGVLAVRGAFRSSDAAGYLLSEILDRFVAFLNFWQNNPSRFTYPESARAVFRLGPTYSVFEEESQSYGMGFWINPDFEELGWHRGSRKERCFAVGIEKLKATRRLANRNPLFDTAIRCMSLLNTGWTAREDHHWLMLVWACFEKIFSAGTDGTRGGYAAIARRAAKFDANPAVREAVLQTLANHRNGAAHSNGRSGHAHVAREVVSECSRYLLWLLRWLLREGHRFETKAEFLDWVDIPKERETLLRRRKLNNMALTYWHPREENVAKGSKQQGEGG